MDAYRTYEYWYSPGSVPLGYVPPFTRLIGPEHLKSIVDKDEGDVDNLLKFRISKVFFTDIDEENKNLLHTMLKR